MQTAHLATSTQGIMLASTVLFGLLAFWLRSLVVAVDLPVVDLGYARYRAGNVNETGAYYNFTNIRYAAPPVGPLRFSAPSPPIQDQGVQDGKTGHICHQSTPGWFEDAIAALGQDLLKYFPSAVSGETESEDCLFLDVVVPVKLFESAKQRQNEGIIALKARENIAEGSGQQNGPGAPVLFNIHGGGFFLGEKRTNYDPQALLKAAGNEIIYVSVNYRLAAFGFLSGLSDSPSNTTSPNAGLLDQRFALKWVQKYIHLFGGDPRRVTIIGQSAGGGSVEFHTTAYGGAPKAAEEKDLFAGAIAQSPDPAIPDPYWRQLGANRFLEITGARSVDELRGVDEKVLAEANVKAQAEAPATAVFFGPAIDGDLILDIPSRAYSDGRFNKAVRVMSSYNADEGLVLAATSSIKTNADYDNWIRQNFFSTPANIRSYISEKLYPPIYDGSLPYRTPLERLRLTAGEFIVQCNAIAVLNAYGRTGAWGSTFSVPPAVHSQDLLYVFNQGGAVPFPGSTAQDEKIAEGMQGDIVRFVMTGDPTGRDGGGSARSPRWQEGGSVLDWNADPGGVKAVRPAADNDRCAWWLKGLWAPEEGTGMGTGMGTGTLTVL